MACPTLDYKMKKLFFLLLVLTLLCGAMVGCAIATNPTSANTSTTSSFPSGSSAATTTSVATTTAASTTAPQPDDNGGLGDGIELPDDDIEE